MPNQDLNEPLKRIYAVLDRLDQASIGRVFTPEEIAADACRIRTYLDVIASSVDYNE